ncbi:hypothetical protein [Glycomyces arizonensis]|uniref:hypothetical protein n=1 Tax=Glycomyces arizonensis TaxID=256035 RepID=UPI0003F8C7E5|nr:hypothetical protein [Glycomyces arizonensis]
MPDRDTVHLRRQAVDNDGGNDEDSSGSDDGGADATALLGPPKRKRLRDHRSTVIDLRGGKRPKRETRLDMGVTMVTDTRTGAERDETPPSAPKRRRRLLIGTGVLAAVAVLTVSLAAAYGGDAGGAVGGECVYNADEAAIAPGGGWRTQPCALPSPSRERYQVLLRIEGTAEADACGEHLSSWGAEGDRAAAVGAGSRPAVLCLVFVN